MYLSMCDLEGYIADLIEVKVVQKMLTAANFKMLIMKATISTGITQRTLSTYSPILFITLEVGTASFHSWEN
jgi:hypothetical protein